MDIIGIDLHKRESQLCIIADDGTVTERRIVTSRERFTAVLAERAGDAWLRIALTRSPASEASKPGHDMSLSNAVELRAVERRRAPSYPRPENFGARRSKNAAIPSA